MLPVSFALLMALGLAIHRLTFRRLARTSPDLDVFEARGLMVAFGLMFLVQNLAQWLWGGELRGYDWMAEPVAIGGARFAANKLLLLALALADQRGADRRPAHDAARQGRARADAVADRRAAGRHRHRSGCIR